MYTAGIPAYVKQTPLHCHQLRQCWYHKDTRSSVEMFAITAHRRYTLLWRHHGRDGVSKHQPHDCLLNRSFRRRSKKTSKLRVTGICVGNTPVTTEFPAQMASNAENVSIWWRHHIYEILAIHATHWGFYIYNWISKPLLCGVACQYIDTEIKTRIQVLCKSAYIYTSKEVDNPPCHLGRNEVLAMDSAIEIVNVSGLGFPDKHEDIMTWKRFQYYWLFVRGIH